MGAEGRQGMKEAAGGSVQEHISAKSCVLSGAGR